MAQQNEVRQCEKCQQPAVLLVNEWQHTNSLGATGQVTQDYRCQQCGASFTRSSKANALSLWVVGILGLPMCGVGLPFLWLAWRNGRFDERLKVLRDVPVPAMRFPNGPPRRLHAGCSGIAHATRITRHVRKGIPTGTEYTYQCAQCSKEFTTETWWSSLTSSFLSAVSVLIAFAFFTSGSTPAWKYGGAAAMSLVTVVISWGIVTSLINRFKHKEVTAPVAVNELR